MIHSISASVKGVLISSLVSSGVLGISFSTPVGIVSGTARRENRSV